MSAIQKELVKATGVDIKRKEDRQEFIIRLMVAITALSDKEWDGLSKESQDWFNDAADAKNANKKTLPDFPDLEEEQAEEPTTTRRRGAAPGDALVLKTGCNATVVTKRGKEATGKVVEFDDDIIVLEVDGKEVELNRVGATVTVNPAEDDETASADPVKVGTEVTITTKRGKEVTGKIVEMDAEVLVLDVDGKDEEFMRDRVETIKPIKVKGKAKDEDEKPASRRGSTEGAGKEEPESKGKRVSNEGVSIGTRIKELIADDLDATEADIAKRLKKEGLEFKENTLKLNYVDAHKFVVILKAAGLLKK